MSLSVKRKADSIPEEPQRSKRARVLPPSRYEGSDSEIQKALSRSMMDVERLVKTPRAWKPLSCGRFEKALTPKRQEIHELILQHFEKLKVTRVTERDLRRMCLEKDSDTQIPKDLRIIDVPGLGKGVFLSCQAKPIKATDNIGIYEGTVQLIYKNRAEATSAYKWALFDYDLEIENGRYPVKTLEGWSEILDGEKALNFAALINACHPDHTEDANVVPRLVLLKAPDGSISLQLLYVAIRPIIPGEQLLVDYGRSYFENLEIIPIRITPRTYTLDHQNMLVSEAQQSSSSSSSSSSSPSSVPLDDEEDYKESLSDEEPPAAPRSRHVWRLKPKVYV